MEDIKKTVSIEVLRNGKLNYSHELQEIVKQWEKKHGTEAFLLQKSCLNMGHYIDEVLFEECSDLYNFKFVNEVINVS